MILSHCSDLHSVLFPLPKEAEIIINTGDFLPNKTRGDRNVEPKYQLQWLNDNLERIKRWLDGRLMIFCSGNHDILGLSECENLFKSHNINIIDITNTYYIHPEFNIYGYPSIPYIDGEWNYERYLPDLANELRVLDLKISDNKEWNSDKFSILACHCPPYGVLDEVPGAIYSEHFGNRALTNKLVYNQFKTRFDLILCGHIHQAHNWDEIVGIPISNAATTVHLFEIKNNMFKQL